MVKSEIDQMLEYKIWHLMRTHGVSTRYPSQFVEAVVTIAAELHRRDTPELQAMRRAILKLETR